MGVAPNDLTLDPELFERATSKGPPMSAICLSVFDKMKSSISSSINQKSLNRKGLASRPSSIVLHVASPDKTDSVPSVTREVCNSSPDAQLGSDPLSSSKVHEAFGLPLVETPNAKVELMPNGTYRLKDAHHSGINPFEKVGSLTSDCPRPSL